VTNQEFEARLDVLWREKYTLIDSPDPHWTLVRDDADSKHQFRDMLIRYALESQPVGLSRQEKNTPGRIFEELGMEPSDLNVVDFIVSTTSGKDDDDIDDENPGSHANRFSRIMYIERKAGKLTGEARIGRVTFTRTRRTLYYGDKSFRRPASAGFKSNYYCVETGENYWISGCKRDGTDRLYDEGVAIHIDDDVREEYWTTIRKKPGTKNAIVM
jgi:hypothetical protein